MITKLKINCILTAANDPIGGYTLGGSAGVKVINVHTSKNNNNALLQIKNNFYIQNKVIPFFEKYPVLGVKSLDFHDFKNVAKLVKNKEHLTSEGLSKILTIVAKMNLDRNFSLPK